MASMQALKSRIRSVKNTKQITKAMEMVAASKMRRAQEGAKASAAYARRANELLTFFSQQDITSGHPLFAVRPIKSRLLIVVASDKGLAGAYNSNVLRTYFKELKADRAAGITTKTIAVGRKVAHAVSRLEGADLIGSYEKLADRPGSDELMAIRMSAREQFLNGEVDAVDIVYTEFVSSLKQTPKVQRLLPAGLDNIGGETYVSKNIANAKFEPSPNEVLEGITTRLLGAQVFQAMLDARASEHSMRMMAMKNATDNANDLAHALTLEMNKERQAAITQELSEISAGVEAMK